MTNDELAVIRQINGEGAVYDAHLSGYDVIVPVQIHQDGARCAVEHHMKEIFFSAALIIDMTVKAARGWAVGTILVSIGSMRLRVAWNGSETDALLSTDPFVT